MAQDSTMTCMHCCTVHLPFKHTDADHALWWHWEQTLQTLTSYLVSCPKSLTAKGVICTRETKAEGAHQVEPLQ